jgi:FAD/FMN-containing dehydrogenase
MRLDQFIRELGSIPHTTDPSSVRRMSRDMSGTFSPILKQDAAGKTADLIVMPQSKDDVIAIARAAARAKMPLMCRGGGTCNFGQGIPLAGGAIIDITALTQVISISDRAIRAEPGIRLWDVDRKTQDEAAMELRIHPSTRRAATLGGFIGGGHVGIGSCNWGILRDRGNILGMQVVSVEEEPQLVELRGADVNRVHHAYGTNGIMVEIEMPLAPAYRWREAIVSFKTFMEAGRFALDLNQCDGVIVKLISIYSWPFQKWLTPLAKYFRDGEHTVHVMVADEFSEAFDWVVNDCGGNVVYSGLEGQGDFGSPLYEFSFGHSGLYARKIVPNLVSNLGLIPHQDLLGGLERVYARFSHLGPFQYDMKRIDGTLTCQGSPSFPFVSAEHLQQVIADMEEEGVRFANVHTLHVRENGMKAIDISELAFKKRMDPYNLMNPGKFSSDDLDEDSRSVGAALPTSGWRTKTGR